MKNTLNSRLGAAGASHPLFGLFMCSYSSQVAEALAYSGYDFLIFDAEHGASSLVSLHAQLMALAATDTAAVIRVPELNPALFKQYLDLGAQAIMVPDVRSGEQAKLAVSAMRYPPAGRRGVGGSVRATRYGRIRLPLNEANQQASLFLQIESAEGLTHVDDIAGTEGVDVVFFGPTDLSADLGYFGEPGHAEVRKRIRAGIERVVSAGKVAAVLANEQQSVEYMEAGASVVTLGSDLGILVANADALAQRVRTKAGI